MWDMKKQHALHVEILNLISWEESIKSLHLQIIPNLLSLMSLLSPSIDSNIPKVLHWIERVCNIWAFIDNAL